MTRELRSLDDECAYLIGLVSPTVEVPKAPDVRPACDELTDPNPHDSRDWTATQTVVALLALVAGLSFT